MKNLPQSIFVFLVFFTFACGGSTDKTQDSTQKDSSQTATKEEPEKKEENKEETNTKQQVITGTFAGIEQGDYFYFKIKPETGEEMSLMVLQGDDTYETIAANPDKYKGVKVKVYWEASKENIPEAGGEMEVEKYIKAEILK